jgi:O-antigen ligase
VIIGVFLVYALISSFWSIAPKDSISVSLRLLFLLFSFLALQQYIRSTKLASKLEKLGFFMMGATALACILAMYELSTFGSLYRTLKPNLNIIEFYLSYMNRGCSYVVLSLWVPLYMLLKEKQYIKALLLCSMVAMFIVQLESQASIIAILCSAVVFILTYFFKSNIIFLAKIMLLLVTVSFPIAVQKIDPDQVFHDSSLLSVSSQHHRLKIWNFAADKASEKMWFGWGMSSTRNQKIDKSEWFDNILGGKTAHPLPLHPHNYILHVWLELGVIGVVLFTAFLWSVLNFIAKHKGAPLLTASAMAMFTVYTATGMVGYGTWQSWWIAGFLINISCLHILKKRS